MKHQVRILDVRLFLFNFIFPVLPSSSSLAHV